MTSEQEREDVHKLITARSESHGDAGLVVVAAILAGRVGMVHRFYVMEKLHQANGPHPENLLDDFTLERLLLALEQHADDPIQWLAETSNNQWR